MGWIQIQRYKSIVFTCTTTAKHFVKTLLYANIAPDPWPLTLQTCRKLLRRKVYVAFGRTASRTEREQILTERIPDA